MAQSYTAKDIDESHVAPPPGSVPTTRIPLTFLDVAWLFCPPMQRLFFYELPYPTSHLTQTIIPHLKQSLSVTLHHFFPLAANLICPLPPNEPYILCKEGDSVAFTVAESDADFDHLVANYARDNRAFKSLVKKLSVASVPSDKERVLPIMVMQLTVFPNSGISIGITFNHMAADGRSFTHFMKSWASVHRSEREHLTSLSLPYHNKAVIKDPDGLLSIYLKDWWSSENSGTAEIFPVDNVRVTLVLSGAQIEKLKWLVTTQTKNNPEPSDQSLHMSTFVVTCAFIWVNLVKLKESETSGHLHDDLVYYFVPVADCRERFDFPISATYFGNCLSFLFISAKGSDLMGKDGIVVAAKAIGRKIYELEKGPLMGAEKWMLNLMELVESERAVSIDGSPKLRAYDTDFGWGRPKKIEVAHIGPNGSFSIAESRDEEGAVEVGLVIGRGKIDIFNVIYEQGLNF